MSSVPCAPMVTESTTTVVIGSGLSGLAVASELSRQGVDAIIVDGLGNFGTGVSARRNSVTDPTLVSERNEILRHLRNYATRHQLDIRQRTRALELTMSGTDDPDSPPRQWMVQTADGVLLADHIVLTRCAQSQLRRLLTSLGIAISRDIMTAMRAVGIYLVGVGELITPTTREVLRQAKIVSQAISAKTNPDGAASVQTGSFAALPSPA